MLLGIDIGGSGSRVALATGSERLELRGPRVAVTAEGGSAEVVARDLLSLAERRWPSLYPQISAVGIGATGLATLVRDPDGAVRRLARAVNAPVAAAIDAVTAHLGALAGTPGAVISLGTGAIAIGWDGEDTWRRVDGWGHLLGDRGGGAWIGMRGLNRALAAHDGTDPAGAALLRAATARFGEPLQWPAQFYTQPDRAGVLASFAADVVELADDDRAARAILTRAAAHAAASLSAAAQGGVPPVLSAAGGLARSERFLHQIRSELAGLRPDAELRPARGASLDGALELAGRAAAGKAQGAAPYLWVS